MGTISKPYTFSPNTTMSSSEMNSNFDVLYNEVNGSISAANLATDSVTTAKIADSNVTTAKIADSAVTTAKINDGAVTGEKVSTNALFLSHTTRTSSFALTTSDVLIPGLTDTITVPSGGRKLEVYAQGSISGGNVGSAAQIKIWRGSVGSGTIIASGKMYTHAANAVFTISTTAIESPAAGSHTYSVSATSSITGGTLEGSTANPAQMVIKLL